MLPSRPSSSSSCPSLYRFPRLLLTTIARPTPAAAIAIPVPEVLAIEGEDDPNHNDPFYDRWAGFDRMDNMPEDM